ncbi:hypothetical protein E8E11_009842 [Didymella keratinophila]|nr:hypothetical protein E8E11_009842 [Didymella keratinophila]
MSSKINLKKMKSMRNIFGSRKSKVEEEEVPPMPTFALQLQHFPPPKPFLQPSQHPQHPRPPPQLEPGSSDRIPQAQGVIPVERPKAPRHRPAPKPPAPIRITAESMRKLRGLIRDRYALDIDIWSKRNLKRFQRDTVMADMVKSDAALVRIRRLLEDWDNSQYFERPEQHAKFREIKGRLMTGEKRLWASQPPWMQSQLGGDPHLGPFEADGQQRHVSHRYSGHSNDSGYISRREDSGRRVG